MSRYRSLILSLLAMVGMGVALAVKVSLGDNHISASEWVQISIAAVTAWQVWLTKNEPGWTWAKTGTAAGLAILSLLVGAVTGGLSMLEIVNLIIAGLGVLGVGVVPNVTPPAVTAAPARPTSAGR